MPKWLFFYEAVSPKYEIKIVISPRYCRRCLLRPGPTKGKSSSCFSLDLVDSNISENIMGYKWGDFGLSWVGSMMNKVSLCEQFTFRSARTSYRAFDVVRPVRPVLNNFPSSSPPHTPSFSSFSSFSFSFFSSFGPVTNVTLVTPLSPSCCSGIKAENEQL